MALLIYNDLPDVNVLFMTQVTPVVIYLLEVNHSFFVIDLVKIIYAP